MAKGLIGKKIGMTQIFDAETKEAIPVTVVEVGPCTVTQIKTEEVDGYCAAQVGYLEQKPQRVAKPQMGHFQKAGTGAFKVLKEFSVPSADCKVGDVLTLDLFQEIEKLDKDSSYYVYCRTGVRSANSCQLMSELGFKNVFNLVGGIVEWNGEINN